MSNVLTDLLRSSQFPSWLHMQAENPGDLPANAYAQLQGMSDAAKAAEERIKASRWQIASGSLSMLESVYAVEPFPGG